jgi:hypothetical protein
MTNMCILLSGYKPFDTRFILIPFRVVLVATGPGGRFHDKKRRGRIREIAFSNPRSRK